jgi:hypothetical protein
MSHTRFVISQCGGTRSQRVGWLQIHDLQPGDTNALDRLLPRPIGLGTIKGSLRFGLMVLMLGSPNVIFFQGGGAMGRSTGRGVVVQVVFALAEAIMFSWVFGIDRDGRI